MAAYCPSYNGKSDRLIEALPLSPFQLDRLLLFKDRHLYSHGLIIDCRAYIANMASPAVDDGPGDAVPFA